MPCLGNPATILELFAVGDIIVQPETYPDPGIAHHRRCSSCSLNSTSVQHPRCRNKHWQRMMMNLNCS